MPVGSDMIAQILHRVKCMTSVVNVILLSSMIGIELSSITIATGGCESAKNFVISFVHSVV